MLYGLWKQQSFSDNRGLLKPISSDDSKINSYIDNVGSDVKLEDDLLDYSSDSGDNFELEIDNDSNDS